MRRVSMRHAQFLTGLETKLKDDRDDVIIIAHPLIFYSAIIQCEIAVPVLFESDGSSVPRLPIIYNIWGNRAHREGVLHDFLFRKNAFPSVGWSVANDIFFEAMESLTKPWWLKYPMYTAVCVASHPAYHRKMVEDKL